MFKILGRNLKKSLSLFVVFFTISIVFSVFSSYIETQRISSTINNQIFTNKFITFQIGNTAITNNDFMETQGEFDKDNSLKLDKKYPGYKGTQHIEFENISEGEKLGYAYIFQFMNSGNKGKHTR